MPDDVLQTTTEAQSPVEVLLAALRAAIQQASARGQPVDELWQQYVGTYLEDQDHPETLARSSSELTSLAQEITGSLDFTVPEITSSLTREQLEAILAQKDYPSADPSQQTVHLAVEPVMTFNGQFIHAAGDIRIDGAGIDFIFRRVYKNQVRYDGPLGFNWDHSYNLWLRTVNDTVFRATGALREDAYLRHPKFGQAGFSYFVPPDGESGILLEDGDSFVWRSPAGDRYVYERDLERPFLHRIARIEDRHGNALGFAYADGRLDTVAVNHPRRVVRLLYDDQERIVAIEDYTGRVWRYEYDDLGDLVAVTTPATDRYRAGLTTTYEYSSAGFSPGPPHNLVRILDPAGRLYLENEYGADEIDLSLNRVVRQRQGDGETTFEYQSIVQEFDFDYSEMERPAFQTLVVEPNGHPIHYVYNRFGNLLLREENLLQGGRVERVQWRYRYNGDGAQIGVLSPDGVIVQRYHGRDDYLRRRGITDADVRTDDQLTAAARQAFGNLLAIARRGIRFDFASLDLSRGVWGDFFPDIFAPSVAAGPSRDVVAKYTYEPTNQQLRTSSDPRFTSSADPDDPETLRYQQTLTRYEFFGPPGDPSRLLERIRFPDLHRPDGNVLADVTTQFTAYDDHGRWLRRVEPDGIVTEREYLNAANGVREGYLRSETVDPQGLAITTGYEVNDVGVPVAIVDPRGFRTGFEVNELDQIVRTTTTPPFSHETRYMYDPAGQLERVERDLRDDRGLPFAGGTEVRTYRHDERGNLLAESVGAEDPATHLVTTYRYDASGQRVRTTLPNGNQAVRAPDERHLERSLTRGAGTQDASTSRSAYSLDGLRIETIDGMGSATRYQYDALGRWVATVDPLGNVTRTNYDKAGNPIVERFFELQPDGTYLLLTRAEFEYDELHRRVVERVNLFRDPSRAADPAIDFLASPGPGSIEVTQLFRDRGGRLVRSVDRDGHESIFDYDAAGRRVAERDPLGNMTRLSYDPSGNVTRMDLHEQVLDPAMGAVLREDVFSMLFDYDELDRRRAVTDGLGNTTTLLRDSRDDLVRRVDPLGGVTSFEYDVYGRQVAEAAEVAPAVPPVTQRVEYDANANVIARTDPRGARTIQQFDVLDRRTTVRYPDGTTERFTYDAEGRTVLHEDNNGLRRRCTYDVRGQVVRVERDTSSLAPGVTVEGATFEAYDHDGLQRLTMAANDHALVRRRFDSLGRVYEETVIYTVPAVLNPPVLTIRLEFDALGMVTQITYPSGRVIRHHFDALNRIERIENATKGNGYPGTPSPPDSYDVLRNEFRGLRRARRLLGNGATTTYAFDQGGRIIEIAHRTAGSDRLVLQQLFDGAGNVRIRNELTASRSDGEACAYNALFWLTAVQPVAAPVTLDPSVFGPPAAVLPRQALAGQSAIDAVIGSAVASPPEVTYRYDAAGSREEEQESGAPATVYVTNALNEYTTVAGEALQYDANGNLIRAGGRRLVYDYRNQLVRVRDEAADRDLLQLFYDVHGRQIASVNSGVPLHLVFDGPNAIEEYRNGVLSAQYVHEFGVDALVQISAEGEDHWYHADLVRSSRRLSDATGEFDASYRYTPFGLPIEDGGPYNPNLFHGRRFERQIELYDLRARHYSPRLGRFLQRDVLYAPNLYLFVQNNPLIGVDPSGREREPIVSGIEVISLVPPTEAITPAETVSERARIPPPEIVPIGDGDCNPVIQSCEPTSRPLIPGLVSSPPGNPVQELVERSRAYEDRVFGGTRSREQALERLRISATEGGLAGAAIIARAGASIASMQAETEIMEAGLGALSRAVGPLGRLLLRETPELVEAEALAARAVRMAPVGRAAVRQSTDQVLIVLRDQATNLTRRLGIKGPSRFGTVNDRVFKSLVKDAIDKGYLPSTLRVTPGRPGVFGIDVWDSATGVGWDLTTATVRQVAGHERYLGMTMPDGTQILDVRPLVYTR
jgi:RHS repeat-associated protein